MDTPNLPLDQATREINCVPTASIGQGYVYDFENHLIQAGGVTFTYDGDGNRVQKVTGGVTTQYTVDSRNPTGYAQVLAEWKSTVVSKYFIYGLELLGGDSGSQARTRQKGRVATRSHALCLG